jgi:hypothetical protein
MSSRIHECISQRILAASLSTQSVVWKGSTAGAVDPGVRGMISTPKLFWSAKLEYSEPLTYFKPVIFIHPLMYFEPPTEGEPVKIARHLG